MLSNFFNAYSEITYQFIGLSLILRLFLKKSNITIKYSKLPGYVVFSLLKKRFFNPKDFISIPRFYVILYVFFASQIFCSLWNWQALTKLTLAQKYSIFFLSFIIFFTIIGLFKIHFTFHRTVYNFLLIYFVFKVFLDFISTPSIALSYILFGPFFGALFSGFFGWALGSFGAQVITLFFMCLATLSTYSIFIDYCFGNQIFHILTLGRWIKSSGLFFVSWDFRFDSLSILMLVVILTVSSLVHVYSCRYMYHDPHLPRFMSYLSLFTFFMILLVTGNNILILFLGWEGVGVCSFLLISFWFTRIQANKSALKAIIMNRIGDIGVTLSICLIYYTFNTLDFEIIFTLIPYFYGKNMIYLNDNFDIITLICVFLFIGSIGKSAQIGLHTWLPEAMEAPTPVSALLHAATMVTAGVFLVIKTSPIFEYSSNALLFVTFMGALTTFFASTSGMVQNDIKRIIAYSTASQLGYMVFTCGLSSYNISLFHLYTHAFFKALLFLSAGSIIHGLSSEQDIRKMGGLINLFPFTYMMFLIGSLALMGFPFLSGYYSKDLILEIAYTDFTVKGLFSFWLGSISAICTVYYSIRLLFLVFLVKSNSYKKYVNNAHEADFITMLVLFILSLGSIFLGYISKDFFAGVGSNFFKDSIFILPENLLLIDIEFIPKSIKLLPTYLCLLGTFFSFIGYKKYYNDSSMALKKVFIKKNSLVQQEKNMFIFLYFLYKVVVVPIYKFLVSKWYFDSIYNYFITRSMLNFGYFYTFKTIDKGLLEVFGSEGLIHVFFNLNLKLRKHQSGYIYHYLCILLTGLIYIIAIVKFM